jgi:hypothetical protein
MAPLRGFSWGAAQRQIERPIKGLRRTGKLVGNHGWINPLQKSESHPTLEPIS